MGVLTHQTLTHTRARARAAPQQDSSIPNLLPVHPPTPQCPPSPSHKLSLIFRAPPRPTYRVPLGVLSLLLELGELAAVDERGAALPDEQQDDPDEQDGEDDGEDDPPQLDLLPTLCKTNLPFKPTITQHGIKKNNFLSKQRLEETSECFSLFLRTRNLRRGHTRRTFGFLRVDPVAIVFVRKVEHAAIVVAERAQLPVLRLCNQQNSQPSSKHRNIDSHPKHFRPPVTWVQGCLSR